MLGVEGGAVDARAVGALRALLDPVTRTKAAAVLTRASGVHTLGCVGQVQVPV